MTNNGTQYCGSCRHFDRATERCTLRQIPIEHYATTSCRDWNTPVTAPTGPLYAIVCEVRNRGSTYATIPYWGDARPRMVQQPRTFETYVSLTLPDRYLRFDTILEYLEAMEREGLLSNPGTDRL